MSARAEPGATFGGRLDVANDCGAMTTAVLHPTAGAKRVTLKAAVDGASVQATFAAT